MDALPAGTLAWPEILAVTLGLGSLRIMAPSPSPRCSCRSPTARLLNALTLGPREQDRRQVLKGDRSRSFLLDVG